MTANETTRYKNKELYRLNIINIDKMIKKKYKKFSFTLLRLIIFSLTKTDLDFTITLSPFNPIHLQTVYMLLHSNKLYFLLLSLIFLSNHAQNNLL